ncbi:hypothetical protein AF72_04920 [Xylella taiwanensis]|uniref:Uncharacterized protein n=1 Tax=Xylella taiwanensis TaxID=1444770 RepID=Z9JJQ2_9GAMM|nr:hypothetical protein AB672_01435 [Xylella taiwanensis]EWS78635.1 hypothetical protein AF72_04920 [Xylella taiwanensis]
MPMWHHADIQRCLAAGALDHTRLTWLMLHATGESSAHQQDCVLIMPLRIDLECPHCGCPDKRSLPALMYAHPSVLRFFGHPMLSSNHLICPRATD